MSSRRDFLSQAAPENYVAGLGRGATGFTTRSDLGPARDGPSENQIKEALAKRAAQLGAAAPTAYGASEKKDDDEDEERFQDPENEVGLFAGGAYDKDDDEADRIYQEVDERMDRRRKIRRSVSPPPKSSLFNLQCSQFIICQGNRRTDYRPFYLQGSAREGRTRGIRAQ
jgi:pre-mRNA-processing factor 6